VAEVEVGLDRDAGEAALPVERDQVLDVAVELRLGEPLGAEADIGDQAEVGVVAEDLDDLAGVDRVVTGHRHLADPVGRPRRDLDVERQREGRASKKPWFCR
jgi:hypothetical protein